MVNCESMQDTSLEAKRFFIEFRVSALLIGLTIINVIMRHIDTKIVPTFSSYKHHSAETNQEMTVRFMQVIFGFIIGFFGYVTLIFNGISGCNISNLYVFFCGGYILVCMDTHEYVRRWPLRTPVLGHHIMVFFLALAIFEYDLLPPGGIGEPFPWVTTLFISNIGVMWITDFFHVIFRVSTSLPLIERLRKYYLYLSVIRPINVCLMVYGAIETLMKGSIVGALPNLLLALAYGYNTYKAIIFVYNFNCEKYFISHQVKWAEDKFGTTISAYDARQRQCSVLIDPVSAESLFDDDNVSIKGQPETQVLHRASGKFGRRSSVASLVFAIDVAEEPAELMHGLRGDVAIDEDLKSN